MSLRTLPAFSEAEVNHRSNIFFGLSASFVFLVASPATGRSIMSNHPSQTPLKSRDPPDTPSPPNNPSQILCPPAPPIRSVDSPSYSYIYIYINNLMRLANWEAGLARRTEKFTFAWRKRVFTTPTASSSADLRWLAL